MKCFAVAAAAALLATAAQAAPTGPLVPIHPAPLAPETPKPYAFEYGVEDSYSGAAFGQVWSLSNFEVPTFKKTT